MSTLLSPSSTETLADSATKPAAQAQPDSSGGLGLNRDILHVVIESRQCLENIDTNVALSANPAWKAGQSLRSRVFKDYILSTETYKVKSGF